MDRTIMRQCFSLPEDFSCNTCEYVEERLCDNFCSKCWNMEVRDED